MSKNRYSVVGHYTNNLVFDRIAPGLLNELQSKSLKNEKGYRSNRLHQWLTEDVGDPMLAQHLHSIVMLQRLAVANGHGWNRFLHTVDQFCPGAATCYHCHSANPEMEMTRPPTEAASS